ncbi:SDR family NAD(P)-dependent oxidoreductase [Emticicia sp. SJ17W-69]|uniref:SDR family NAD(P)-dependent oxidoreductase n=1 Tax=Emticicia sp. SJ17W-69 TaxID=3421657 RepID=UPI003EBEDA6F
MTNYQGALQQPTNSDFNAQSTSTDVIHGIDLTGKIAIVTGGNSGIGLETAKTLANAGATVIVPARDIAKAKKNLHGLPNVEIEEMDLMNHSSIDNFAIKFLASGRPLHLLINNAGIMWVPLRRDNRGIESQLAVNYLAQFHLTSLLWAALKKANGARIINLTSQGHHFAPFDFADPNFTYKAYETLLGYGQSKTAIILFSMLLAEKAKPHKVNVYSVHPGSVNGTELGREASLELFQQMGFLDAQGNLLPEVAASLKSIPRGAATTVWCATSTFLNEISGVYCEDCNIANLATEETKFQSGVMPYALNIQDAEQLWVLSEKMTNIPFEVK